MGRRVEGVLVCHKAKGFYLRGNLSFDRLSGQIVERVEGPVRIRLARFFQPRNRELVLAYRRVDLRNRGLCEE